MEFSFLRDLPSFIMEDKSIQFFIPMLPISVNSAYTIAFRTLKLTRKAWEKKGYMSMFCKKINVPEQTPIKIDASYYGNWFYKNGKYKRVDGPNYDKMLYDVVCEKLCIDDCFVFEWSGRKVQSNSKEGVLVTITILEGCQYEGRNIEESSEGDSNGPEKDYGASWN